MAPKFKDLYTFEQRRAKFEYQRLKDPNKIPIVCEELHNAGRFPELETRRLLVPPDITVAQLTYLLRRRMSLSPEEALFIFSGSSVLSSNTLLSVIYERHKDPDGFFVFSPMTLQLNKDGMDTKTDRLVLASLFVTLSVAVKLLLLPSRHSTDFEVHRNWLAVTLNLPLKEWYREHGSVWTLDYPPLFAYFELAMAKVAKHMLPDASFFQLRSYDDAGWACRVFQKGTVIVSDVVLYGAVFNKWIRKDAEKSSLLLLLLFPALIMIDHMHFQYNGLLVGLFLLSVNAIYEGRLVLGSALFTALVCSKHLFLVFAPVLGLHVLATIFSRPKGQIFELALTAYGCVKVLCVSFLPFMATGQIPHIARRLFPTQRGLMHAYWAPNFWALYAGLDLTLQKFFALYPDIHRRLFKTDFLPLTTALTNGLTGEKSFSVLPGITPTTCILAVALAHLPILYRLLQKRSPDVMIRCLCMSGAISFCFGYHVHEKASIPFMALFLYFGNLFNVAARMEAGILMVASCVSLVPLMQGPLEMGIGVIMTVLFYIAYMSTLGCKTTGILFKLRMAASLAPIPLALIVKLTAPRMEFLPLLIYSVMCGASIFMSVARLYVGEMAC